MLSFKVDPSRCTLCDLCVRDCPSGVIRREGSGLPFIPPEEEDHCIRCQHCLAICPSAAVSILERNPESSARLGPAMFPSLEQMSLLIRGRRSVRQYRDENVDPSLIRSLLVTLAHVPTGVNRRELTFHVISNRAVMQQLREKILAGLRDLDAAGRLPARFGYLLEAIRAWDTARKDIILRGAPHALIVSAPPDAPCPREDVVLSLAYFDLLAQCAGLGTLWCGMLKIALEVLPSLKELLGLPRNHPYYGMLFGKPAISYARTVQRDDGANFRTVVF